MAEQHEKALVPQIRFTGFTDPWEQRKLGKVGITYSGLHGKTKDDFGHGDAFFVPYTNVFDNPVTDQGRLEHVEVDSSQAEVKHGDVFFTVSSETPEEVGMSSIWLGNIRNVYLNSFCFGYRQDGSFDSLYLAYVLRSQSVRKQIELLAQGISRFNISKNKVMNVEVPKPSLGEQRRIGAFLDRLDSLITLHQGKYDKLCVLKKSMLDKMFPKGGSLYPEIRFAGFTDPWEQRKLGELASKRIEKNTNGIKETFTNSAEHGVVSQLDYFDHDITNDANIGNYSVVHPDDFIYNPRISAVAPCGPINRNKLDRNGVMSPLYTVFSVDDTIDKLYLEHYFKTSRWHQFMFLEGNSGARSDRFSISDSIFFEMPIQCPVLEEQELIASFFGRLDSLITLHQRKLELLRNIKKSMLDKMFV